MRYEQFQTISLLSEEIARKFQINLLQIISRELGYICIFRNSEKQYIQNLQREIERFADLIRPLDHELNKLLEERAGNTPEAINRKIDELILDEKILEFSVRTCIDLQSLSLRRGGQVIPETARRLQLDIASYLTSIRKQIRELKAKLQDLPSFNESLNARIAEVSAGRERLSKLCTARSVQKARQERTLPSELIRRVGDINLSEEAADDLIALLQTISYLFAATQAHAESSNFQRILFNAKKIINALILKLVYKQDSLLRVLQRVCNEDELVDWAKLLLSSPLCTMANKIISSEVKEAIQALGEQAAVAKIAR